MTLRLKVSALAVALAVAVGAATAPAPAHAGGVPVIDVAAIAEAIKQYEQMVQQLEQLQAQLDQAKKLYSSMTGDRGMQDLLANEARNVIPTNWQETLAQMGGGDVTGLAKQIRDNASRIDANLINDLLTSGTADASRGFANSAASAQASAGTVYDNAAGRYARLQSLVDAIGTAQDAKAIADLQARIEAEQTMLQNESIQMAALAQAADAQARIERQQVRELTLDKASSNNALPRVVR